MLLLWLPAATFSLCSSISRAGVFAVDFESGTSGHMGDLSPTVVVLGFWGCLADYVLVLGHWGL